jgi:hypothetical protein
VIILLCTDIWIAHSLLFAMHGHMNITFLVVYYARTYEYHIPCCLLCTGIWISHSLLFTMHWHMNITFLFVYYARTYEYHIPCFYYAWTYEYHIPCCLLCTDIWISHSLLFTMHWHTTYDPAKLKRNLIGVMPSETVA